MGLFSSDKDVDRDLYVRFLSSVVKGWNGTQGAIFGHKASVDSSKVEEFLAKAEHVMGIHFPGKPSAFKRLGTWLVLSQHIAPFAFQDAKNTPFDMRGDCDWMPRIAVAALAAAADKMTVLVNGGPIKLEPFALPSPHFQAELISILRLYRLQSIRDASLISPAMLADRSYNASLIIEASYYVHRLENDGVSSTAGSTAALQGKIEGCLATFNSTQIDDVIFNDEEKLILATEMGD